MKKETTIEALLEDLIEKKIEEKLGKRQAPGTPDENKWLTIGVAAKEFGCTPFSLQKAIAENEIDSYQPDGRTYVRRKDVAAWIESVRIRANSGVSEYEFLNNKK